VPGPALRRVGTMIEEPSFYPYMTGRDNLRYAARLHGGVPERRIDEVLDFVKLDRASDKRVKAYSQGMRQRLGLARSLLWSPEVLLLDEPTNGLDPVGIAEIRENLRAVAAEGVTVLVSSHILARSRSWSTASWRSTAAASCTTVRSTRWSAPRRRRDHLPPARQRRPGLLAALRDLGLEPVAEGELGARVTCRRPRPTPSCTRLVRAGVEVLEARRQVDDLEGAYLRLVRGDGRPS
jgi:ABC-type nitrate/sulfonate/bicarbonate transport system ATPase subunit